MILGNVGDVENAGREFGKQRTHSWDGDGHDTDGAFQDAPYQCFRYIDCWSCE